MPGVSMKVSPPTSASRKIDSMRSRIASSTSCEIDDVSDCRLSRPSDWMYASSPPPCASRIVSRVRISSPRIASTSERSSFMYAAASTSTSVPSPSFTLMRPDTSGSAAPASSTGGSTAESPPSRCSDSSRERRYSAFRNMYPVSCIEYMREATFWPVEATEVSYSCGGRLPSSETTVERTACCTSGGAVSAKLPMSSGAEMFVTAS
mmetsp:Transcript_4491/g.14268  ORF Transcript_4491/g.14268 Transcript_4491/m.14268 type:complete len:207 (+) Transcript_4491:284-904(+)